MALRQETAETLALQALDWLVRNDELLPIFLGSTGASETDLKDRVQEQDFLGAVLDFLMQDDAWIIGFCDAENISYDRVLPARAALSGGEEVHWT